MKNIILVLMGILLVFSFYENLDKDVTNGYLEKEIDQIKDNSDVYIQIIFQLLRNKSKREVLDLLKNIEKTDNTKIIVKDIGEHISFNEVCFEFKKGLLTNISHSFCDN
ncbi:Imm58 family immunity protein [Dentiradicibacter hellwigii]|jgi:hypothetical protein|uniref:Uncharacterized protein n=1 Tax=Dentiradicibacter hellwigii TaxID=3149053 RepID=A0ABV4UFQ3_9RHOO